MTQALRFSLLMLLVAFAAFTAGSYVAILFT